MYTLPYTHTTTFQFYLFLSHFFIKSMKSNRNTSQRLTVHRWPTGGFSKTQWLIHRPLTRVLIHITVSIIIIDKQFFSVSFWLSNRMVYCPTGSMEDLTLNGWKAQCGAHANPLTVCTAATVDGNISAKTVANILTRIRFVLEEVKIVVSAGENSKLSTREGRCWSERKQEKLHESTSTLSPLNSTCVFYLLSSHLYKYTDYLSQGDKQTSLHLWWPLCV